MAIEEYAVDVHRDKVQAVRLTGQELQRMILMHGNSTINLRLTSRYSACDVQCCEEWCVRVTVLGLYANISANLPSFIALDVFPGCSSVIARCGQISQTMWAWNGPCSAWVIRQSSRHHRQYHSGLV